MTITMNLTHQSHPKLFWTFFFISTETLYLNIKWGKVLVQCCVVHIVLEQVHVDVGGEQEDGLFYRFVPVTRAAAAVATAAAE